MSGNILEAKGLYYTYADGTKALENLDITIKKGKVTALLGGNGAGKSTLFLNLNGILKPSSGEILYQGKVIDYSRKGLKSLRKAIGLVFQDPDTQLFSASVYQDVSFGPINLGLEEEEIRYRVRRALERTGMFELQHKPTHCLSFGQKKRVAIAGILAMEPEVVILDEPTAGLDPMGVSEIMKLLTEMKEQMGISIIIATHDIDIVPLYCDDVYVMDKGKIILKGTPKQIFKEAEILRSVHLRLPRVAHLMEILQKEDKFEFEDSAATISEARKLLKRYLGK
jgi:cobalt/nickel transport system ATP-binding protein